ncbi:MAG: hypothetical protein LC745_12410 [Planctomycetia bacterium]|nr:hypothetical protein [Planctomycetia bacterium]
MTSPWQYALTVGPLGFYLWVLASWQGDGHPRVIRGLADFALLAFGPFGATLARMLSPRPDVFDRVVVVSGLGLVGCLLACRALKRLVVYQVEADRLVPALDDVLRHTGGRFVRTIEGFEDVASGRGLRVDFTPRLRCAVVEAYGFDADGLIQTIRPLLALRLLKERSRPSSLARFFYGGSVLVMTAPLVGLFLTQPHAREALRGLLRHLEGG